MNITRKEITNRFDFKDTHVVIDLNKKDFKIEYEADDDMKMRQLIDVLIKPARRSRGIDPIAFDCQKQSYPIRQGDEKRNTGKKRPEAGRCQENY